MRVLLSALFAVGTAACVADTSADPAGNASEAAAQPQASTSCTDPATCTAASAVNDSFGIFTSGVDECGEVEYVDYGPGAEGGGNNDDYVVIHDWCPDGHGVKAWVWLTRNGVSFLHEKYNGNGYAGPPVIWDPFKEHGNVQKGDSIGLKVCLVDGNDDASPSQCGSFTMTSADG